MEPDLSPWRLQASEHNLHNVGLALETIESILIPKSRKPPVPFQQVLRDRLSTEAGAKQLSAGLWLLFLFEVGEVL